MDYVDKKILIIGMARSGIAVARVLASLGGEVTIADQKSAGELTEGIKALHDWPVKIKTGGYPLITSKDYDLVVTSPGVPVNAAPLVQAVHEKLRIISEIELAARLSKGLLVAITGTNGKTTTTELVGQMLLDAGEKVIVGGNIGTPLVQQVQGTTEKNIIVVEVSSFQLEWVDTFCPKVAIITNITPDHLDRHGDMENYVNVKARIFAKQTKDDWTVLNYDDLTLRGLASGCPGKVIFFSHQDLLEEGIFVSDDWIKVRFNKQEQKICKVTDIKIPGIHNLENAMAAIGAGWALGLSSAQIKHTLETFPGVEHRLEPVVEVKGVLYINDSKATNPEAAIKAIEAFDRPLILIAGGSSKGSDFTQLAKKIAERVKHLVVLGDTAEAIIKAVNTTGFSFIHHVSTFQEAVSKASELARPGEIILLSPACASYDMFDNYEHRGEVFKKLVHELV